MTLDTYAINEAKHGVGPGLMRSWRFRDGGDGLRGTQLYLPNRWRTVSKAMHWTYVRWSFLIHGRPSWFIVTNPYGVGLARRVRRLGLRTAYYCHDPFEFYDNWNPQVIREHEEQLLAHCDLTFCVSRQLVDDFRPKARGPVVHQPNGVSRSFLDAIAADPPRPGDLPSCPTLGCVGQINDTFDWDLIEAVADGLGRASPDAKLVFVGPMIEGDAGKRERIEACLRRPNVLHTGKRPHERLPAYLSHFNVLWCPMRLSEHNHRRSPLRLYDYLATDRPVLTTALREAAVHDPHLTVIHHPADAVEAIVGALRHGPVAGERLSARRAYIERQTWQDRAASLLERLRSVSEIEKTPAAPR